MDLSSLVLNLPPPSTALCGVAAVGTSVQLGTNACQCTPPTVVASSVNGSSQCGSSWHPARPSMDTCQCVFPTMGESGKGFCAVWWCPTPLLCRGKDACWWEPPTIMGKSRICSPWGGGGGGCAPSSRHRRLLAIVTIESGMALCCVCWRLAPPPSKGGVGKVLSALPSSTVNGEPSHSVP